MTLRRSHSDSHIHLIRPMSKESMIFDLKSRTLSEQLAYLNLRIGPDFFKTLVKDADSLMEVLGVNIKEPAYVNLVITLLGPLLPHLHKETPEHLFFRSTVFTTASKIPPASRLFFLKACQSILDDHIQSSENLSQMLSLLSEKDCEYFVNDIMPLSHLQNILRDNLFFRVDQKYFPVLFKRLGFAYIAENIKQVDDFKKALTSIKPAERFGFLYDYLGMDKLRGLMRNQENIDWVLSLLSTENYQEIQEQLLLYRLVLQPAQGLEKLPLAKEDFWPIGKDLYLCTNRSSVFITKGKQQVVKEITVDLNDDELERINLVYPISETRFVVITYDHCNIINDYKTWQLHLGDLYGHHCRPLFKVHRDQHFYPNHLALLPDKMTLVGWNSYDVAGADDKFRKICLINLKTNKVQTIELPFRPDVDSGIRFSTKGHVIFRVKGQEHYFQVESLQNENKKIPMPFFKNKQNPDEMEIEEKSEFKKTI